MRTVWDDLVWLVHVSMVRFTLHFHDRQLTFFFKCSICGLDFRVRKRGDVGSCLAFGMASASDTLVSPRCSAVLHILMVY